MDSVIGSAAAVPRYALRGDPDSAAIKRFVERSMAQPELLARARRDPAAIAETIGIALDPLAFRDVWDRDRARAMGDGDECALSRRYREVVRARQDYRDWVRWSCGEAVPRYRAWRQRQMARAELEFSVGTVAVVAHLPVALELSRGCSGGCWFCGLAAPPLSAIHPYTAETGREWRALLAGLAETIGPAVRHGFCYWATDPLDNPDYERFSSDFADILGIFPVFTTALALRDPERTRRLLRLAERHGGAINRFSLLSLAQLEQAHATFTADELALVECLPFNPQSRLTLATAGRARTLHDRLGGRATGLQASLDTTTIACVSGFLINMVDRSVKLISPCPASERWPLGYRLWWQDRFVGSDDLLAAVAATIEGAMALSVADLPKARFDESLRFTPLADGFRLDSDQREIRCCHADPAGPQAAYLRDMGQALAEGTSHADDIALLALYRHGVPTETTLDRLEDLFGRGLLQEAV